MIKSLPSSNWFESGNAEFQEHCQSGKVYLIGAGPGDVELITVKGLRYLRQADVVLYDRLVNAELLNELRPGTERVFVGKGPGHHALRQEEINTLLIYYAQQGRTVVRLKGGDPFVFGRGGEEALALAQANIPFEIVPGISSAIAVPAYAGIPVTHRDYVSSVTIVTGHDGEGRNSRPVPWETLAKVGGTLVILMGVKGLAEITTRLMVGGLGRSVPAALIQEGASRKQRLVTGTLENIAERAAVANIQAPAVIVIGTVVSLSDALAWYEVAGTTR